MNWIKNNERTLEDESTLCALLGEKEGKLNVALGFWNKEKNSWDSSSLNMNVLYYCPIPQSPTKNQHAQKISTG
jgi:hypothetical protein